MSTDKKEDISFIAALSLKERKLVAEIAAGASFTLAMRQAGYSLSTAIKQQARTRNKPQIKKALLEIYYKQGTYLTDEELAVLGKPRKQDEVKL